MRNIIAGLILTGCMLPVAAGAMKIATDFGKVAKSPQLANLDIQPLWTSDARRVDVNRQGFERVQGTVVPDNIVATAARADREIPGRDIDMRGNVTNADPDNNDQIQMAVQTWCSARYRSYDPSDNSYQPYDGGARKPCAVPAGVTSGFRQVTLQSPPAMPDQHVRWCSSRYSSYRVEDNTYQPFSGGRKQCNSREVQSASNESLNDGSEPGALVN